MSIDRVRLFALMKKETLQIVRDPSSIAIAIVLPVVLLFIFGYGVTLDARHVPIGVVIDNPGPEAADFVSGLRQSEYFEPIGFSSIGEAQLAMMRGKVDSIIWFKSDFARKIKEKDASIGVFVNGVDANTARLIEGYLTGVWGQWLTRRALMSFGAGLGQGAVLESRIWFNPEVRSRNYLVPGLIAVIMTLTGALLTAMVVAREWERGTMEALMSTPVTIAEILVGKVIPYFMLGMGGMGLSVLMAVYLFNVPFYGSYVVLFIASSLYLLAALGMGLLISTVARSQFVAGQMAIIATYLPAFILSGFIFDIRSMPFPIRVITHVIPARYFVSILQTVFSAGDVYPVIFANAAALVVIASFFMGVVAIKSKKHLR
ncbi:MAG: ABC transporter permease [Dissulfurimicrobium sp.]|uniref:ABC transporter permease n=1 Tax=Dissulfurimicrobium TaxID=1769732 RepID=UPI001EDB9850|nr:ABC transporter permease [Dissulfurimicrobium hydrothermale]UKL12912.1 ABC transporter permease [Dissulfurimicrobium hydrothermale]